MIITLSIILYIALFFVAVVIGKYDQEEDDELIICSALVWPIVLTLLLLWGMMFPIKKLIMKISRPIIKLADDVVFILYTFFDKQ